MQEQNPELAESGKSSEDIKEATTVDGGMIRETVKKHAKEHKQKEAAEGAEEAFDS